MINVIALLRSASSFASDLATQLRQTNKARPSTQLKSLATEIRRTSAA